MTFSRYGKEDDHFVLELVYNYTINSYTQGNNFQVVRISPRITESALLN
jgi:hypothetical protein